MQAALKSVWFSDLFSVVLSQPLTDAKKSEWNGRDKSLQIMTMETDSKKTKPQLIEELESLRSRVAEFERLESGGNTLPEYEFLASLFGAAPIGLCYLDTELRYTFVNDWLADINGVPVDKHLGRSIGEVLPEAEPIIEPMFREMIKIGEPVFDASTAIETPAQPGVVRYFRYSFLPVKSPGGTVIGVTIVVVETTEQRRAEDEYQDLYDNAPDMFASVDATTARIVKCNNALAVATGYSKDELLALPHISNLYHPDSETERKKVFADFVEGREVHDVELFLKRKDGSKSAVSLNISPVFGKDGKVVQSRSIWRDITERRLIQDSLRASETQLRLVTDNVHAMIAYLDSNQRYQFINEFYAKNIGTLGKNDRELRNALTTLHREQIRLVKAAKTAPLRQQQPPAAQARLQILNQLLSGIQALGDWRR